MPRGREIGTFTVLGAMLALVAVAEAQRPLPDLVPNEAYLDAPSFGSCSFMHGPVRDKFCVSNLGDVAAGPFVVDLHGRVEIDGLAANTTECFFTFHSGAFGLFVVDVDDQVVESNEENNSQTFSIPELSATPTCAMTWTPTATPTWTPTSTAVSDDDDNGCAVDGGSTGAAPAIGGLLLLSALRRWQR